MFVIQRLYAGNKFYNPASLSGWSLDIKNALHFDSEKQAKTAKKIFKLHSCRIVAI